MASSDGLNVCCNEAQSAFGFLYFLYWILSFLLSDTLLAKPLRLLATAVHEMSHAAVCWLTGGRVMKLAVYENTAGVTYYRGGCQCLIAPAGYLGEAWVGMLLTICSGGRRTSTAAAVSVIVALALTLCYSPNRLLVYLCLFYIALLVVLIFLEWYVVTPILFFCTLLFGVFLGVCSVGDIGNHLICHSRPGSDAYAAYEETGRCCPPRCIGVMWLLLAIAMQVFGVILALALMSEECYDKSWWQCVFHTRFDVWDDWDWWPDDWDLFEHAK